MSNKYFMKAMVPAALFLAIMTLLTGCATENRGQIIEIAENNNSSTTAEKPVQIRVPPDMRRMQAVEQGPKITPSGVEAEVTEPEAVFHSDETMENPPQIPDHEVPGPAGKRRRGFGNPVPEGTIIGPESEPTPQSWTGSSSSFLSTDFDENGDYTGGYRFIPPDCSAAAGPDHVVNVVNVTIAFHEKDGTQILQQSLKSFFTLASPPSGYTNPESFTFDPKVIYDQYSQRFLLVTLEHIDNGPSDEQSRIYVAVSDDADPTGNWYVTSIDAKISIGGIDRWADYPGFAVDEEAVYITNNMFAFDSNSGAFGGVRLWVIDKGETDGFYANNTAMVTIYDPYAGGGIATTTQPAHAFGTVPAGVGTFLVSYSGIHYGDGRDLIQVVRVDNPLATPIFTHQYVILGDIEESIDMPNAPQSGSTDEIETNDRRALNSVWRDNKLWLATTILGSGDDDGQATAYWVAMNTDTLSALSIDDQGQIDGEDIATGTHTFFPSIAVNSREDVVIGFSASAPTIYPGAYFTTRAVADPLGSTGPSQVVQAGTDYYYRAFGGPRNRWGDYSGSSVDPATECFWVYNEYAMNRGTIISGEDGRWGTAYVESCPCSNSYDLTADQWKMFSLSCNVGSKNSVANIFGDDLPVAEYDITWIVFRRDELTDTYEQMTLSDTLEEGRSYWITTTASGNTVTIKGIHNDVINLPLIAESTNGIQNMAGHPFNSVIDWEHVKVIYGASEYTLAQADPEDGNNIRACEDIPVRNDCVMSRVMHKWNGASYDPYDGETPGLGGTLNPMDGFWVKAFKEDDDLALRVQTSGGGAPLSPGMIKASPVSADSSLTPSEESVRNIPADTITSKRNTGAISYPDGWFIRLVVESGQMRDGGNVIGQLSDSVHGYDKHDLKEIPPFDNKHYLTIVFPHEDWGKFSGEYASDFRSLSKESGEIWDFTVKASDDVQNISLSFEGMDGLLEQARLIVLDGDGRKIESRRIKKDQKYHFTINNNSRSFKIETLVETNILFLIVPVQASIHQEKMKKK